MEKRSDPRGFPYYWVAMGRLPHRPTDGSDLDAAADGFVAVTPLQLDLTHRPSLATLHDLYA
jgi:5'-nucleotidase